MSPKALRGLAAACAALAALWVVWAARDARARRPQLLFAMAASADSMTLDGPDGRLSLLKREGAWSLEKPFAVSADAAAVAAALDELAKARLSGPLSDDAQRLSLFGLQDSAATRLALTAGGRRLEVLLGGPGAGTTAVYVRDPGSPLVREASGLTPGRLRPRPELWTDKTLAALDTSRISRLSVRSPQGRVVLERKDGVWLSPGSAKLGPLLEALTRFSADDVLDASGLQAEPRARLDRVEFEVQIEVLDYAGVPGQAAVSFTVSPQGQDFRHLARVKGRDGVVYSLAGWRLDPFRLDPKDFR